MLVPNTTGMRTGKREARVATRERRKGQGTIGQSCAFNLSVSGTLPSSNSPELSCVQVAYTLPLKKKKKKKTISSTYAYLYHIMKNESNNCSAFIFYLSSHAKEALGFSTNGYAYELHIASSLDVF